MNESIAPEVQDQALPEGAAGQAPGNAPHAVASDGIRNYNLASQERMVRGRMPTLELINERFSRNLRAGLFNLTRKTPEVSVGLIQVQKYSAFLRQLVVPTNFNVVAVQPLRGSGLIVCDPPLVFAVIDSLFGGQGRFHTRMEGREFSATEMRVIQRLVQVMVEQYNKAWHGIYPLQLRYQRSEMQPQFANIAGPGEIVVSASFTLEIGEVAGDVHVCIPYATLEPIRDVLYANAHSDGNSEDQRWVKLLKHQIQAAEVTLTADLGQAPATLRQLLALKVGDFVELGMPRQIKARVDGVPVFECQYGTTNGKYALKVEHMLTGSEMSWLGESNV